MNFSINFSFVNQVNDSNIFEVYLAKMALGLYFLKLINALAFIFQLVFLCRNQLKVSIKLTPNPATPDKKGASQV